MSVVDAPTHRRRISLRLRRALAEDTATTDHDLGDVELEFGDDALVGDLVLALAADVARSPSPLAEWFSDLRWAALLLGSGQVAGSGERLAGLAIADGDEVTVAVSPSGRATGTAVFGPERRPARRYELAPVGDGTGGLRRAIELPSGTTDLGRSSIGNAIVVEESSVSRRHAAITVDDQVTVTDLGSTNGTFVDGRRVDVRCAVAVGSVVSFGEAELQLRIIVDDPDDPTDGGALRPVDGRAEVNPPPPLVVPAIGPVVLDAPEVPARPDDLRLPWLSILIPLVLAAGITIVPVLLGGFDARYAVMSGAFLLLSPVMMAASGWEARRAGRRRHRARVELFDASLDALDAAGRSAVADELRLLEASHPGADVWQQRARRARPGLWSSAERFDGRLRAGVAPGPTMVGVAGHATSRSSPDGDGGASARLAAVAAEVARHDAKPVTVAALAGPLAVVGPEAATTSFVRWMVLQAATALPPGRLRLVVLADDAGRQRWDWVKWLPHQVDVLVRGDSTGGISEPAGGPVSSIVVADAGVDADLVAAVVGRAESGGLALWWIGDSRSAAPSSSHTVVEIDGAGRGRIDDVVAGSVTTAVTFDRVDADRAERWARDLAPWIDGSAAAGGSIPTACSLVDLLATPTTIDEPETMADRWRSSPQRPLAVALGEAAGGRLVIDLRSDGPHALVAGTTGAGKSELLQTLVAGLAAEHPPSRITFLLVDYKGGAAFGECARLPHTVGLVTDLDGHLVDRVLTSLRAELRRREAVLAAAGAKDLATLEALGDRDAPPSLVIVVDEFATIAAEVPGFVDGVIDLARRGRSLGLHLVLATQRPAGVVSEHVLANANLRICLRVADEHQSVDVVGVPDAAVISRAVPGRAVVRLGAGEVVRLQCGYGGGRTPDRRVAPLGGREVRLASFALAGAGRKEHDVGRDPSDSSEPTDLARLVRTSCRAMAMLDEPAPRRPWLAPLPDRLSIGSLVGADDTDARRADAPVVAPVGLMDEPDRQRRSAYRLDLSCGPTLVLGGSSPATADLVRALVVGATVGRSPRDVQVDIVDSESGSLGELERLPQVGTVVDPADADRLDRLLRQLRSSVARPGRASPQRVLVVLDAVGLIARLDRVGGGEGVEALLRLAADGAAAGVHLVLVSPRRYGLPSGLGSIRRRLVMEMGSDDDLAALGIDPRLLTRVPAGRAVVDGRAVQTAVLDLDGPWSFDAVVAREARRWGALRAPRIGSLPTRVDAASLRRHAAAPSHDCRAWGSALLGVADTDLAPVHVDLGAGNLLIAGPLRSGRTTALGSLAASLCAGPVGAPGAVRRILVAARRSEWADAAIWHDVAIGSKALTLVRDARAAIDRDTPPLVVFVDDSTDLDDEVDAELAVVAALGREFDVRVVAVAEAAAARRAYGGLVSELRRDRRALLLQPDVDLDGDLAGVRLGRRSAAPLPPGRGELVDRGHVSLVQVAAATPAIAVAPRRALFRSEHA